MTVQTELSNRILELFQLQARENRVYAEYVTRIGVVPQRIQSIQNIPFLPIEFFKTFKVQTGNWSPENIFESSGTTGQVRSRHLVKSLHDYRIHTQRIYENTYGSLRGINILALLPGYAHSSSLVHMVRHFIVESQSTYSDFYSDRKDYQDLRHALTACRASQRPTVLIGVTFSLLDVARQVQMDYPTLRVIETGGMKGRGEEMTRHAVHVELRKAFGVTNIHSEYGMTELMSQAYAQADGRFKMHESFQVLPGDMYDPLALTAFNQRCRLHVIDLANRHTCAFLATSDIGLVYQDSSFEVLGRMDHAELRGCNLMYA